MPIVHHTFKISMRSNRKLRGEFFLNFERIRNIDHAYCANLMTYMRDAGYPVAMFVSYIPRSAVAARVMPTYFCVPLRDRIKCVCVCE